MADLALVGIMALWGSTFAILRALLGGAGAEAQATPLAIVAARMGLASVVLLLFMLCTAKGRAQLRSMGSGALLRDGLVCGALLGFGFLLQIEGLQRTSASRSGFLTGLLVVLVPVIELALFRKLPAVASVLGILLAFAGMSVLKSAPSVGTGPTLLGDWLTVGCALVFAGHVVFLGRVASRHPVLPLLWLQLATTGALAALVGPLIEAQHLAAEPRLFLGVLYLSLFATLLAFGVQTWAQQKLPPVRVALLSALEPLFAALWAFLLIGEQLSRRELFGGALIVLGVVVGEAGGALARRRAEP